jgi:ribosome biogenesis GTPase A
MSLQWYPGHMTKARRELFELAPSQHVIIEVLDARMPKASSNPLIAELARQKPRICVLTKSDLADPEVTEQWVKYLEAQGGPLPGKAEVAPAAASASAPTTDSDGEPAPAPAAPHGKPPKPRPPVLAIAVTTERQAETRALLAAACKRLGFYPEPNKRVRALIAGVPNVGKSSLINTLMQQNVAKVGDKPAVTKVQQQAVLKNGLVLTDSPGMMWPKIEDEAGALRLGFAGSIPDTAVDYFNLAVFGAKLLLERYGKLLVARFKLDAVPASPTALLEEVGRRRGALRSGGVVDLHKASEILVREFRSGGIGRITLETPPIALS